MTRRHRAARGHPRLRRGGQDRHRPEDGRQRALLDGRPRGLLRGLRARLAPGAGRAGLARHAARARRTRAATWRRRCSRASPSRRCATWRSRPTTRPRAARGRADRPAAAAARRPTGPRRRRGRRPRARGRARPDARPARPLGARGGHRGRAPRPAGGAARAPGSVVAQSPEPGAELEAGARPAVLDARPATRRGATREARRARRARLPGRRRSSATRRRRGRATSTHDSRKVGAGRALRGHPRPPTDGNRFVDAARKKGAVAVVSEEPPRAGQRPGSGRPTRARPWRCSRRRCSAIPPRALELVGVTGTNGKTTTTYLIDAALRAAGETSGLLGTIQYRIGDRLAEAVRTTPEASDLQALLREMVDARLQPAVMEVSSHALALERVDGCALRGGRLHQPDPRPPRLPRRHGGLLRGQAAAVRHAAARRRPRRSSTPTTTARRELRRGVAAAGSGPTALRTRGRPGRRASCALGLDGTRFRGAHAARRVSRSRRRCSGRYNVENLLAALGAALALGLRPDAVARGTAPPWRRARAARAGEAGQAFMVVVDYAHTDDALKQPARDRARPRPRAA